MLVFGETYIDYEEWYINGFEIVYGPYYEYEEVGYSYLEYEYYFWDGYTGEPPVEIFYGGPVFIEVDNDGNVSVNQPDCNFGVVFYMEHIYITFPFEIYHGDISLDLPAGFAHGISHEGANNGYIGFTAFDTGNPVFTVVTVRHTWADSSYVGFQPFIIGAPFPIVPNVNSNIALANALNPTLNPGNRVINITGTFNVTGAHAISGNRTIIIATNNTNLNNDPTGGGPIGHTFGGTPFILNFPTGSGRHFNVAGGATLVLSHVVLDGHRIDGQTASRGGVSVNGSSLVMNTGSVIRNSRASGDTHAQTGGAVNLFGSSTFTMHNGLISNNEHSHRGGGVSVRNGSSFTMRNGIITGNIGNHAGGVEVEYGTFTMNGGNINNNETTTGTGGGVRLGSSATFTMNSGTIESNTSMGTGGGVRVANNSIFTMYNGIIRNNTSNSSGGGVAIGTTNDTVLAVFHFHNGVIEGNRANNGGGVQVNQGNTFNMHGGAIRNNRNLPNNNNPISEGGGVRVIGSGTTFTMTGGTIGHPTNNAQGNRAVNGGGVWVGGGATFNMQQGPAPGNTSGTIHINEATTNGGGVFINNGTVTMSIGTITENNSLGGGGGVEVRGNNGVFTMHDGVVNHNTAQSATGGGVRVETGATVNMHGGTINHNTSQGATGGGAMVAGTFNMFDGTISHNTAVGASGGGMSVIGGTVYIHDGTIESNRANNGGGVRAVTGATVTMHGGTIRNHQTRADGVTHINLGGGVLVDDATFIMTGGTIGHATDTTQGNRALNGGGVWAGNGASFYMIQGGTTPNYTHGTIIGNEATGLPFNDSRGGGVYVTGITSTFDMYTGLIYDNTAGRGGGVSVNYGTFNMSGGDIENNTGLSFSGGVVVSGDSGVFNMYYGSTISHNEAVGNAGGGVLIFNNGTFNMFDGIIEHNTSSATGGGVRINDIGTFNMFDGVIRQNTSNSLGGGVAIGSTGVASLAYFNMHGGVIERNRAFNAGGVAISGGNTALMTGGVIRNNRYTPTDDIIATGGGVRVVSEDASFTMTGGTIGCDLDINEGNRAQNGGGVWVGLGASFTMQEGVTNNVHTIPQISGNVATATGASSLELEGGGGVYVIGNTSSFTMRGGVIGGNSYYGEGNTAINGGGVHLANGANMTMEAGTVTIGGNTTTTYGRISGNMATGTASNQGGGGVFAFNDVGFNISINMSAGIIGGNADYNEGNQGQHGGGVFLNAGATLQMSGGRISGNTAVICGGGVCVGATPHLDRVNIFQMTGGTIGGDRGYDNSGYGNTAGLNGGGVRIGGLGTFTMQDGTIFGNAAVNGGGVWLGGANGSMFNMSGGTIGGIDIVIDEDDNPFNVAANRANNGGGVFVTHSATFSISGSDLKTIIGNEAEYDGGGVWVAIDATMTMASAASNLHITHNTAGRMGGGIFTQRHEYANPLTRYPGSPLLGAQTVAYSNLTLRDVTFNNNSANRRYVPPVNATAVLAAVLPDRAFISTSQPTAPAPIRVHPLNNYDINFHVPGVRFDFHKTNQQIFDDPRIAVLLPGAQFRLFRADTEDLGGTGQGGLVPNNIAGTPWEEITDPDIVLRMLISTNVNNEPVSFYMTPGFVYQLVEHVAPSGYQIPFGQWRLRLTDTNPAVVTFEIIGDPSTPGFIPNNFSSIDIDWFLGNRQDFTLPLTGGVGMSILLIASGTMFVATAGVMIIFVKKRSFVKLRRWNTCRCN